MSAATRHVVARMVEAANELLASFDDTQRERAAWPFPAEHERRQWFYTPTDHGGLPLTNMSSAQHRLVHRLVATGLSTGGYVTAAAIMGLENVLDHTEGWTAGFERERGRDPLLYYVTIFGEPHDDRWGWRFGGHHVSIHHTVVDGDLAASTPCFFGADPADSPLLGPHLHRPLAGAEDLGRELINTLSDSRRRAALLASAAPSDLVGGNRATLSEGDRSPHLNDVWRGRFGGALEAAIDEIQSRADLELGITESDHAALAFTAEPKGVPATDLRSDERQLLRAVIECYLHRIPDAAADEQLARVDASFDHLHFAWAGGLDKHEPHYYRIQGDDLLIEYDNTQRGANHIHAVWRDLRNDFAGDVLARHYAERRHR